MGIKFPTSWKTLIIKFPPPRDGKSVKCPGYAWGGMLKLRFDRYIIFVSWVSLSTEKAYSPFPRLKNLELILFINTFLLHGFNPRPSLYNTSAKNHLNCLQNLLFESLLLWVFIAIFGCRKFLISGFYLTINNYVFDHSNFPNIMSPGITVKTSS